MSTAVPARSRLRGSTLIAAPMFVIGLIGSSFALALGLWAVWNSSQLGGSFWVPFTLAAAVGVGGFVACRGCFVDVVGDDIRDVVGWVRLQRVDRSRVVAARVRLGAWRWYVLELDDGTTRTLLGASPVQFPARLLPGSDERDLAELDVLLGED